MNHFDAIRDRLLLDLEETLEAQGYIPMYDFAWTLRGYDLGLVPEQIEGISRVAYDELTSRVPMRLMWNLWPKDLDGAWPAAPDTKLNFDLNPDGPTGRPLLLLVPQTP